MLTLSSELYIKSDSSKIRIENDVNFDTTLMNTYIYIYNGISIISQMYILYSRATNILTPEH